MSARLLILCPGQGGQHSGMFDMAEEDPAAAALLGGLRARGACANPPYGDNQAHGGGSFSNDVVRPEALGDGSFSDHVAQPKALGSGLFSNRVAQPEIVAAALVMWEALRHDAPQPDLVAGYSIGELSAWGVAGALAPLEAVRLAQTRAELMDACLATHPGQALLAVNGPPPSRTAALVAACGFHTAIVTGADSCIIGGLQSSASDATARLAAAGARVTALPVEIASHTPLMAGAQARFAEALRTASLHDAQTPVLSGISAARLERREQAIEHLPRQLCEPIVWDECMDACAEAGITVALELGPGAALARMMQARHPGIACRSTADFRSLDGVRAWLRRHCG